MSLEALRQLRRGGHKPQSPIWIVIGTKPRWLSDDATVVIVREADEPQFMDWRPVLGLVVAIFTLQPDPARTLQVLEATQAAGARIFGAADTTGAYPLLEGADERHTALLRNAWETLCR